MDADTMSAYFILGTCALMIISMSTLLCVSLVRARRSGHTLEPIELRRPLAIMTAVFVAAILGVLVFLGILPWPAWLGLTVLACGADYFWVTSMQRVLEGRVDDSAQRRERGKGV
jgi:heme/copper-type cytochrome/quinol oxidase subunit 2